MQTLIATLDAGLYGSMVALLGVMQPGAQVRRAYNLPEINAILEGEAIAVAMLDSGLIGFGDQFSATVLAARYPETRFFVLGGDALLRLSTLGGVDASAGRLPATLQAQPSAVQAPPSAVQAQPHPRAHPVATSAPATPADPDDLGDAPALTGRQAEVLRLVREGKATKEIARHLGLAVPTVKTHLAALYRQLGVRNRVEAAMQQTVPAASAVVSQFPPRTALAHALPARLGLRAIG